MGVWGARTGKRVKVNSCNVILITGTVDCLISEWMHQCLEQIQWITVYIYIQNGISWILRSWRYDLSNLYNPDKTWNSRERNVAIGLPDSPQWKWRVNTKWVKCNGWGANANGDWGVMVIEPGISPPIHHPEMSKLAGWNFGEMMLPVNVQWKCWWKWTEHNVEEWMQMGISWWLIQMEEVYWTNELE